MIGDFKEAGKIRLLKAIDLDGSTGRVYGKTFYWPKCGHVECLDWSPEAVCGGGFHAWIWHESLIPDGRNVYAELDKSKFIVVEVEDSPENLVRLGGKVKFRRGDVLGHFDTIEDAVETYNLQPRRNQAGFGGKAESGPDGLSVSGKMGTSMAGDRGVSVSGFEGESRVLHYGTAVSGASGESFSEDFSVSIVGEYGTAKSGNYGVSISGYGGRSETGRNGLAKCGLMGCAMGGPGAILVFMTYKLNGLRGMDVLEMRTYRVGQDVDSSGAIIEESVPYAIIDKKLVKKMGKEEKRNV